MKKYKIALSSALILCFASGFAQTHFGTEGMNILAQSEVSFDGLGLQPEQNLEIKANDIDSNNQAIVWPTFKGVNKTFLLTKPIDFSGRLSLNTNNLDLNGNKVENLNLAFSNLLSFNYNDFSILTGASYNGNFISNLIDNSYKLWTVTAVSREKFPSLAVVAENFFTPNGDGINDKWVVQDIQLYPKNKLQIFDRAGKIVYEKSPYDNSWGGDFNGAPLAEATYYYTIKLSDSTAPIKGFITIVK